MATYPLKIVKRTVETDDAVSLTLAVPKDLHRAFAYRPGQFLTIEKNTSAGPAARQYSLSSVPGLDQDLRITVRKIEGGVFSAWLTEQAAPGDVLEVQPPRGRFFKDLQDARHVVLLAAGSGIAPIYAIARWLLETGPGHRVTLIYGNRTPQSVILAEDVAALASGFPQRCTVEHVMSRADGAWTGHRGRIDRRFISSRFADWAAQSDGLPMVFYMCGPEGFMDCAESALQALAVPLRDIHRESYGMVLEDDGSEPWLEVAGAHTAGIAGTTARITALCGGKEYETTWQEGESLLAALLRADADVPFACQEGTCSSCIAKLTEGRVEARPGVLLTLRQEDLDEGLTLACLSYPATTSIRLDFDSI